MLQPNEAASVHDRPIAVIGGGHAAAQLCASLAGYGLAGRVHLVSQERELPYHRPPLSKGFLTDANPQLLYHMGAQWYSRAGIALHLGEAVTRLATNANDMDVVLSTGQVLTAARVVFATGTQPRPLPQLAGRHFDNVAMLRSDADARELRDLLHHAQRVAVIGGGYIGLEVAACAAKLGKTVTLLEAAPRLMNRSASIEVADHVEHVHRSSGIDLHLGVGFLEVETDGSRVTALHHGAKCFPVDMLVVGIGASPQTALAEQMGIECANGILVDASMRTSHPQVLAIGDCARERAGPYGGARLESVHSASEQAKVAAATLAGQIAPARTAPWFWSDQGVLKLQIVGLVPAAGTAGHVSVRRPGKSQQAFSVAHYVDDSLVSVESVNAAVDHIHARKLLDAELSPTPGDYQDPAFDLKAWMTAQAAVREVAA